MNSYDLLPQGVHGSEHLNALCGLAKVEVANRNNGTTSSMPSSGVNNSRGKQLYWSTLVLLAGIHERFARQKICDPPPQTGLKRKRFVTSLNGQSHPQTPLCTARKIIVRTLSQPMW